MATSVILAFVAREAIESYRGARTRLKEKVEELCKCVRRKPERLQSFIRTRTKDGEKRRCSEDNDDDTLLKSRPLGIYAFYQMIAENPS